jgi:hypothetical protein
MNRLINNDKPYDLTVGQQGITAQLEEGQVIVLNKDRAELFRFDARACPFEEQPIRFLVEIYGIGFNKGKLIGREVVKTRIYELLGPEL